MKKILVLLIMTIVLIVPLAGAVNITKDVNDNINSSVKKFTKGDFTHTVLAEGGFLSTCPHCVPASGQLYNIYNSEDYDFYYISLVYGKGSYRTDQRLIRGLGVTGTPEVYFDGKYTHVSGEQSDDQPYRNTITTCGARDVPNVELDVNVVWKGNAVLEITGTVQNYDGHLRVYIVEPESRWNDVDGTPFHFGALDIPVNKNLAVQQGQLHSHGDTYDFSRTWHGSLYGFGDITRDNIMVIAAVFDKNTDYAIQTASARPVSSSEVVSGGYTNITVQEAWDLLTTTENGIQIPIDVRTDEEWNRERIKTPSPEDPVHYCLCLLEDENGLQEFMSLYAGREIIVYCGSGGRSSQAAQILADNGFTGTIYNMLGGILAWKEAGYPTPKVHSVPIYFPALNPIFQKLLDNFPNTFLMPRHLFVS